MVMAGTPTARPAGSSRPPIRAEAGDGHRNRENKYIMIPVIHQVNVGVLKNFLKGRTIKTITPIGSRAFAMPTTIEMIATISIKTIPALVIPLKIACNPAIGVPRVIHPNMNIPNTATTAVSNLIAMDTNTRITKSAYTQ